MYVSCQIKCDSRNRRKLKKMSTDNGGKTSKETRNRHVTRSRKGCDKSTTQTPRGKWVECLHAEICCGLTSNEHERNKQRSKSLALLMVPATCGVRVAEAPSTLTSKRRTVSMELANHETPFNSETSSQNVPASCAARQIQIDLPISEGVRRRTKETRGRWVRNTVRVCPRECATHADGEM